MICDNRGEMLHARCDESYAGDTRTTPIYVVAGFIGSTQQWEYFDSLWCESMRDLRVEALGCHASKCSTGAKPYRAMSPQHRYDIQYRLIVDIVAAELYGAVAVSELAGYRSRRAKFDDYLGKNWKKLNEPHLLAVRQCVLLMFDVTRSERNEPVSFIFDQNKEFGGRAREWYQAIAKSRHEELQARTRLGPFIEGDRMKIVGLQAADMLAYAAFRHFSGRPSWQWDALKSGRRGIADMTFDEDYWAYIETQLDEKRRSDANARASS